LNILLKPDSSLPIYEQLVQAFKESMLNGELSPGDMLPSIRSLAKDLEISVITTKRAYENWNPKTSSTLIREKDFL
jgi:GntR family transcriptional regulator